VPTRGAPLAVGAAVRTHTPAMAVFAILARTPGRTEFWLRSDRYRDAGQGPFEARRERLLREVQADVQRWQAVEPATEFRIEERSV
jgi:hypothetical protein